VDTRKHEGLVAVVHSNTNWCSYGFEIECDNGAKVLVAFSLDCCDREIMRWVATTKGIDANLVGDLMMQPVEYHLVQVRQHPMKWNDFLTMDLAILPAIHAPYLELWV